MASLVKYPHLWLSLQHCGALARVDMSCMRPFPKQDNSPKACHDTDACPTLSPRVRGMELPAPRDAPARSQVRTGFLSRPRLIVWGLSTGMSWQRLALPTEARGDPATHDTTVDTACTKRVADGSLWRACIARVAHRAAAKYLNTSVLPGDGTNTVATTGTMELDRRGTSLGQGRRGSRSQTIVALLSHPPLLLPSTRHRCLYCRRDSKP